MASTPGNLYKYEELQDALQTTRMLVLEPALDRNSPLLCRLIPIRLNQMESITALSYAWGEPVFTEHLWVVQDGYENSYLEISPNLSNILRWLRHMSSVQNLWVDAVCINQINKAEKSKQVTEMWRIYSLANKVKIWLGEPDLRVKRLFEDMQREDPEGCCPSCNHGGCIQTCAKPGPNPGDIDQTRLVYLLNHSWFTRRWIVQEALLARGLDIVCGDNVISFDVFAHAVHYLENVLFGKGCDDGLSTLLAIREMRLRRASIEVQATRRYHAHSVIELKREIWKKRRSLGVTAALELLKIIGKVSHTKCKNDQDRVNAITGAVNRGPVEDGKEQGNESVIAFKFPIDYEEDLATTYIRFTLALIRVGPEVALEMLRYISALSHTKNMQDNLPSWVPGWNQSVIPKCFVSWGGKAFCAGGEECDSKDLWDLPEGTILIEGMDLGAMKCSAQIGASHIKPPCVDISSPFDGTIAISGIEADTIKFVSPRIHASEMKTEWPEYDALWLGLQSWWLLACKTRTTSDPLNLGGVGTLLGSLEDALSYHIGSRPAISTLFSILLQTFDSLGILNSNASSNNTSVYNIDETKSKLARKAMYIIIVQVLEDLLPRLQGATFFVTRNGRLGLCCGNPQPEDTIAIFLGAKMPFVVHSERAQHQIGEGEGRIKLIGEAYVSGIMEGEALKDAQTVVLCVS